MATKFKKVVPLHRYNMNVAWAESAADIIKSFSVHWLADKPKPRVLFPDNARSYTSTEFREFMSEIGIQLCFGPEKEPQFHGIVESAIQDIKNTATLISAGNLTLDPEICLMLACSASNGVDKVNGYAPYQWAYGTTGYEINNDPNQHAMLDGSQSDEFLQLAKRREEAEIAYRKVIALRRLTVLKNTKSRQPMRQFKIGDIVLIWRRYWPHTVHEGTRGGFKPSGKPHWIGPGRVVLCETMVGHNPDHQHVIWVLIGTHLFRVSPYATRPATEREQLLFEMANPPRPQTLDQMLPDKHYTDLTGQVPSADEYEAPAVHLPDRPPNEGIMPEALNWRPTHRLRSKTSAPLGPYSRAEFERRRATFDQPNSTTDGATEEQPAQQPPTTTLTDAIQDHTTPNNEESSTHEHPPEDNQETIIQETNEEVTRSDEADDEIPPVVYAPVPNDMTDNILDDSSQEPDAKKARTDDMDYISLTINLTQREIHHFLKSPEVFLVGKMRGSEVAFSRLSAADKKLFDAAKKSEVSQFISTEAVRACIDKAEEQEGWDSGRIMKARWVLTWKVIPPEEREATAEKEKGNPNTTVKPDGSKKAKARIVILGFQHPDLEDPKFKTTSPVVSQHTRALILQLITFHQWVIESCDATTAFLQAEGKEEQHRLWTTGVSELCEALGVPPGTLLRILRACYGLTTAPRSFWQDVDKKMTSADITGHKILGDACTWIFLDSQQQLIGVACCHVDDFILSGNSANPQWQHIKQKIKDMYKWGA